jgi:signal transduction histidine kinase
MIEPVKLTPTGQMILFHSDEILQLWAERVHKKIKNAKNLQQPIIINTLPAYVKTLAEFLSSDFPIEEIQESINTSEEHGGERARLSNYNPSDVISEYQIFRRTLFEILANHQHPLKERELHTINQFIDQSIRDSVSSFELVQFQIREQFMATLTHDLRNPLSAAQMAAELIVDEIDHPKEVVFLVGKVRDNLKRVNRMIQDLLDATLVRTGTPLKLNMVETNMFEVVNEVIKELALIHGPRFILTGNSVTGYWDGSALMRAFENICSNAVKYGEANAPITIRIEEIQGRVMVSVHNRGKPIPVEEQEVIFQAYKRALAARSGRHKGWGLGLPLARAVAEGHGGSVGLVSTFEKGTTFIVDIPKDSRQFVNAPTIG